jgi:hypothetical protein
LLIDPLHKFHEFNRSPMQKNLIFFQFSSG